MAEAANVAMSLAQAERARVAIIGATEDTVVELLGPLTAAGKSIAIFHKDTLSIFVVFDTQRRCRGLYVAGAGKPRTLQAQDWSPDAFLSQAVGRSATLKAPSTDWQTGMMPAPLARRNRHLHSQKRLQSRSSFKPASELSQRPIGSDNFPHRNLQREFRIVLALKTSRIFDLVHVVERSAIRCPRSKVLLTFARSAVVTERNRVVCSLVSPSLYAVEWRHFNQIVDACFKAP